MYKSKIHLLSCICFLFYSSFVVYLRMQISTLKQIDEFKVHCGSAVRFGQALPGFLITVPPSVCVPAVLGALAVWIQNQNKKWKWLRKCFGQALPGFLIMMIAFIAIKSSFVPLIEGLRAQIYFRFEISVVLLTSSSFLFSERKNMFKKNKKAVCPDFCLQPSIYICMCTSYTARYTIATVHVDFFRFLQVSLLDNWAYIRVPHMQCVCVCVHTRPQHIHINPL